MKFDTEMSASAKGIRIRFGLVCSAGMFAPLWKCVTTAAVFVDQVSGGEYIKFAFVQFTSVQQMYANMYNECMIVSVNTWIYVYKYEHVITQTNDQKVSYRQKSKQMQQLTTTLEYVNQTTLLILYLMLSFNV